MAESDAHLTGDQEVACLIPTESVDSRRAFVSFWQKNMHNTV